MQGAVGADLNPANLVVNGFSPAEAAEALGPSILHVHATDAVCDLSTGRGTEVAPGRGAADFPALLGMLDNHAYQGYFTIAPSGDDEPVDEIARTIRYLRRL